jgi:mRNA-degrading endonuclease RelE of RelBE toxin-antitoxin system
MFTFIETRLFSRLVQEYLTDEAYARLQGELIQNPEAGAVIRGSGGVRKLRWRGAASGKRGGYRVIYFVRRVNGIIWMLTIYPKNVTDSIPGHVLKQIREELEHE